MVTNTSGNLAISKLAGLTGDGEMKVAFEALVGVNAFGGQMLGPQGGNFVSSITSDVSISYTYREAIHGTNGDNKRSGTDGVDVIVGLDGDDRLYGDGGNDSLYGDDGKDFLRGESGNDRLYGGRQNDILRGDDGADRLRGGSGNDQLSAGEQNDTLYGDDGDDRLQGEGGKDSLYGGDGNDRLEGSSGSDSLRGDDGDDRLYGGSWGDRLDGDAGKDRLYAGQDGSRDVFIFNSVKDSRVSARDLLFEFDRGEDDIDLRGIDARAGGSRNNEFDYSGSKAAAHSVWWKEDDGAVVVSADVTGDRTADFQFKLTDLTRLSADDFLLGAEMRDSRPHGAGII